MSEPSPWEPPHSQLGVCEPPEATRWSRVEGHLALLLTLAFFASPFAQEWLFLESYWPVGVNLSHLALATVMSVSGVRSGRGGARVSAGLALSVLVLWALSCLVFAFH